MEDLHSGKINSTEARDPQMNLVIRILNETELEFEKTWEDEKGN
jgi:hypothetical protein